MKTNEEIDLTPTPKWIIQAKYGSILQIVLAPNEWESKYPLLEYIVEGLCEERVREERDLTIQHLSSIIDDNETRNKVLSYLQSK